MKCSVEGEKGIDRDRGEPVGSRRNIGGVGILWVDDGKPHDGVTDRQADHSTSSFVIWVSCDTTHTLKLLGKEQVYTTTIRRTLFLALDI